MLTGTPVPDVGEEGVKSTVVSYSVNCIACVILLQGHADQARNFKS